MPRKRNRQIRKAKSLSAPLKSLGGYQQAEHLGDLGKHNADAIQQEEWIRQQEAAKLGVKPEDLEETSSLTGVAEALGFGGSEQDSQILRGEKVDETHLRVNVLGTKGLIMSLAHFGQPGHRQWEQKEGAQWVSAMMAEKKLRGCYTNASRQRITNTTDPLEVIMVRVPPWVGRVVGAELLNQPDSLRAKVLKLCAEFAERYDVDVVGAVVHRESDYDLHVHVVFSKTREKVDERKLGTCAIRERAKQARGEIRAELRANGSPATNAAVSAIFKERKIQQKLETEEEEIVRYERRRGGHGRIRRNTLGHAFMCKLQTWRAADPADKDRVAAFRDRPEDHPRFERSFRLRFAKAETEGQVLEDYWWNLWLSSCWEKTCMEGLAATQLEKVAELGKAAAKNYVEVGKTVPTLVERLLADKQKLETENGGLHQRTTDLQDQLTQSRQVAQARENELGGEREKKLQALAAAGRSEQEKVAAETALERERETVETIRGELAENNRAIAAALKHLGTPAEVADAEHCGALIRRAEQVVIERDQAAQARRDAESENEKRGHRFEEARQKALALENEVTRLGRIAEVAMKLVEALSAKLSAKALNLGKKASGLLEELSILLGRPAKRKQDRDAPEANLPA
jgi:hypothetical protein